jgi:hypothetical protein
MSLLNGISSSYHGKIYIYYIYIYIYIYNSDFGLDYIAMLF